MLAADADSALDILQAGTIRTVVSQATIAEPSPVCAADTDTEIPPDQLCAYIADRIKLLELLQSKIDTLSK